MTKAEVTELQRDLNRFTDRWLEKFPRLQVDGDRGHSTNRRIMTCKWYLGYEGKAQRSARVTKPFRRRLEHPKDGRFSPEALIERGEKRRREQKQEATQAPSTGVGTFDGRPVANWLKPYLEWARDNGWKGTLVSGWRDPVYSEQLCYRMCGAPRCPGRCAGRISNHSGSVKPKGAVDVSDYSTFGALMKRCPYEPRIFNGLGAQDPVHFSNSGV